MQAGTEMLDVLNRELKYTALKQLLTTALAISVGESLLKHLPLGFNDLMYGYFRTLCVGYGIYAVANTMLLLLLYFTDYRGALAASVIFAVGTSVFTVISLFCPQVYYGFGFLAGCVLFLFYSYDPSGTLYQTSAILYSQHTAGGSRRQIGGIYQNRMFYG